MASHNVSPVREQIRNEIRAALANGAAMSASDLYAHCPSATESTEIARIAHDMRRTGLLDVGDKVIHALGMWVNTYRLPTPEDPRIADAKPIVVERKIPRTGKPPKPAQDHPFKAPISPRAPQERHERVTCDLPIHLTSTAPQAAAVALDEVEMSEDPMPYVTDPDTFNQEPLDPEADERIDSDLVDALLELAHLEPKDATVDDAMTLASEYVGDHLDTMARRREELTRTGVLTETPKVCQCLRINSLPRLPKGYQYGGIKVWIESDHDMGNMTIATHDEGGGAFASIKVSGRLSFDPGELVTIGQVADALIRLHEEMGDNHE